MNRLAWSACAPHPTIQLWSTIIALSLLSGCSEQGSQPGLEILRGTIREIDVKNRTLTLEFFVKQSAEIATLPVRVPRDSEIMVRGVVSPLQKLRIGQTLMGLGEVKEDRGQAVFIMRKIFLDEAINPSPTRSPASPQTP